MIELLFDIAIVLVIITAVTNDEDESKTLLGKVAFLLCIAVAVFSIGYMIGVRL